MEKSVEETNFLSQEEKVNTNDMPVRMIGMFIVFLIFGVFGFWSAVAPLDSAALASGVVTVKGNRKTVQHLEGGIIKKLYVRDGDLVEAGDALIRLDDTQSKAELQILKGQFTVLKAQEARLIAERDERENIAFPVELDDSSDHAVEAKRLEKQQFMARRASVDGEIEVLQQRGEQLKAQVVGLKALIKSKQGLIRSYNEEIGDNKDLLSEGFVDKQRLRDLERLKEGLLGEVAEHQSSIAGVTVQIGETKLQILQQKKNFRTEVVNQLSDVQSRVFDTEERILAISDRVTRSLITAPVSGVVLGLGFHTVGGVVTPGNAVMDIVPEGEELVIEAQVTPVDIDRVFIGLEADVRFSSFKSSITPVVKGKVISLSADSLFTEDGMPYYLARVELSSDALEMLDGQELVPGMPAEVLINTGARTLFEYLLQPATDAFARSMIED